MELTAQIELALAAVDTARAELDRATQSAAPLLTRRAAHADVRHAFDVADALLRQATGIAKQHSHREWSQWRSRLSCLDTTRQIHLFAEQDDSGVLPVGSVRAIDTGMSGPDIGDLQHGRSRPAGTPATYGLDLEALLTAPPAVATASERDDIAPEERVVPEAPVVPLPPAAVGTPAEAA
jgi:hypothetical protein